MISPVITLFFRAAANGPGRLGFFVKWGRVMAFIGATALGEVAAANEAPLEADASSEFLPAIQLAPFVVKGEPLSISIHARSRADRRYAERFAEEVIAVAYETLDGSVGAGLVIMGKEGEPHPVFVFRRFLAMAEAGELDPAVATSAAELVEMMTAHARHKGHRVHPSLLGRADRPSQRP